MFRQLLAKPGLCAVTRTKGAEGDLTRVSRCSSSEYPRSDRSPQSLNARLERTHGGALGRLARRRLLNAKPIGILVLEVRIPSRQGAWRSPHGTDWARFDLEGADGDPRVAVIEDGVVLRGVVVGGDLVKLMSSAS